MERKCIEKFNQYEQAIHSIILKKKIDYEKIDYLLKNGASANAIEINEYEDGERDEELLLTQCWLDASGRFNELGEREIEDDYFVKLLKIFIENGLNIDKYVNHLFENIQWTYDERHYIEMTKLILNKLKDKRNLNLERSLSGIGTEESYNNVCEVNHKYANELSTIYEMIEGYKNGKDANKYFNYEKIIGQTIKNIYIFCDNLKVDFSNKMIAENIDIFIECENDILIIKNNYIFVDNNKIKSEFTRMDKDNRFQAQLEKSIINQKIINIELLNEEICAKVKTIYNITKIVITFKNNKKIIIDLDEALSNMRITIC